MRDRGKHPLENFSDFNYSAPEFICKIHPNSTPIGICPFCLRENLNTLVCSVCRELKISCFCSDWKRKRNSNSSDVGSVGRISFLIENEKQRTILENSDFGIKNNKQKLNSETLQVRIQSDQDRVEGLKKIGFWSIVRMFRKKKEKGFSGRKSGSDERTEMMVFDQLCVSRSRSLCSFRESTSDFTFSSAKISDFNSSSERASNFSEVEPRKSSFKSSGLRECDFRNMDESAFIDLKLDLETEDRKSDFGDRGIGDLKILGSKAGEIRRLSNFSESEPGRRTNNNRGLMSKTGDLETGDSKADFRNMGIGELRGGSCRITERDKAGEFKRGTKGMKVWRWILKNNLNWKSRSKRDYEINDVNRT